MKNVATIFTYRFFDFEKNVVRIGGVETYTLDLALLLTREGYETTVYIALDDADEYKECMYKGFSIKEIKKGKTFNECFQNLYNNKKGNGIFIVMTDEMKVNSRGKSNVISVQHGRGISLHGLILKNFKKACYSLLENGRLVIDLFLYLRKYLIWCVWTTIITIGYAHWMKYQMICILQ